MKNSVQVSILGQSYTIKTEAPPEEVMAVADYVNRKIGEVSRGSRSADSLDSTVLAFLNVAGAYLRFRQDELDEDREVGERLQGLLQRLEGACSDMKNP